MRKTLQDIKKKLIKEDIPWLLAGKTAAVLQGALVKASKLTLYTDRMGSYKFGDFFQEYKQQRVKYRENPPLAGHSGIYMINDIEVGIIGDPEVIYQHRKYPVPVHQILSGEQKFEIDGEMMPLLPLPWLLVLGIMGNDTDLSSAVAETEINADDIQQVTDTLGITYYLKPEIDRLLGK